MASLKRMLVGSPIRTARLAHERLTKKTALAIFASDALSSTAYATEQILLVLAAAYLAGQSDAFGRVVPISIAICILLVIVTISYRQTIYAYPSGGGAFIVAKDNLGTIPGLIAGASLLVDYILTVSVSVAAGVEAISNGVQAFKQPESKNAATTLSWMAALLIVMFLGASVLSHFFHVHPREHETVISQIARVVFTGPMGWFYYVVQATTAAILILAANTSFAGFPRLSSLLARDRFLPRQLSNLGDRLVFSNGVILLAVFSAFLVWAFGGDTSRLIPLYAVGVFLSFTLSQAGMVVHWWREGNMLRGMREAAGLATPVATATQSRSENDFAGKLDARRVMTEAPRSMAEIEQLQRKSHWKKYLVINGIGAISTFVVLMVLILTKFMHVAS